MKKYFSIALALLVGFVISGYSSKNIFLTGTPRFNPFYLSNLQKSINSTKDKLIALFKWPVKDASKVADTNLYDSNKIPVSYFKSISKGVSAYEKNDDEVFLKIDKGTKYELKDLTLSDGTVYKMVIINGQ